MMTLATHKNFVQEKDMITPQYELSKVELISNLVYPTCIKFPRIRMYCDTEFSVSMLRDNMSKTDSSSSEIIFISLIT